MYCLGRCYETGSGVKADEKEAQHWYYKGMKAGDRQAMQAFLRDGPEETAGLDTGELENLREAARSGDVDAMYRMGLHCEEGTGTRPDPEQALHWYRQAAAGGHIPALYRMGRCYAQGIGVARDMSQAAEIYQAAAQRGDPDAMVSLAWCYEHGEGVPQDKAEAAKWYQRGAQAKEAKENGRSGPAPR